MGNKNNNKNSKVQCDACSLLLVSWPFDTKTNFVHFHQTYGHTHAKWERVESEREKERVREWAVTEPKVYIARLFFVSFSQLFFFTLFLDFVFCQRVCCSQQKTKDTHTHKEFEGKLINNIRIVYTFWWGSDALWHVAPLWQAKPRVHTQTQMHTNTLANTAPHALRQQIQLRQRI